MKNRKGYRCILASAAVFAAATLASPEAEAQRTMDRQSFISAGAVASLSGFMGTGGYITYGMYGASHYWKAGISLCPHGIPLSTSGRMEYHHLRAEGGYMHRLLATRSRSLNLYAGGTGFIGIEYYDPWRRIPGNIETGLPEASFIYGITASLEMEIFTLRRVAIVIGADLPLSLLSLVNTLHFQVDAGLRISI